MADFNTVTKAVYDLLDGNETTGYLLATEPVIVAGIAETAPADDTYYAVMHVKWGTGEPLGIGATNTGYARYVGFLDTQIRGPLGKGYKRAHDMMTALAQKYEGQALVVDASTRVLFRQLAQDFEGPIEQEFVMVVRVPFEVTRIAAA